MNKGGQFFLIAALVIVTVLFSVTSIVNVAHSSETNEPFYDLSREIKYETKRVLDYGTYYENRTSELTQSFLNEYAQYIAEDRVLFIIGDGDTLQGFSFSNDALTGSVGIVTGSVTTIPIQQTDSRNVDVRREQRDEGEERVYVSVEGVDYSFKLHEGQNFFFVLIREEADEAFVAAE